MNELSRGDTNETYGKTVVTRYWFHNFSHHWFGVYSLKKQNIVNNCPKNEIIRKIIAYELSRGDKNCSSYVIKYHLFFVLPKSHKKLHWKTHTKTWSAPFSNLWANYGEKTATINVTESFSMNNFSRKL